MSEGFPVCRLLSMNTTSPRPVGGRPFHLEPADGRIGAVDTDPAWDHHAVTVQEDVQKGVDVIGEELVCRMSQASLPDKGQRSRRQGPRGCACGERGAGEADSPGSQCHRLRMLQGASQLRAGIAVRAWSSPWPSCPAERRKEHVAVPGWGIELAGEQHRAAGRRPAARRPPAAA
jgi:hypothetical protein